MIPRKKKVCIDCHTEQYIFSHGRCKSCDGIWRAKNKPVDPPQSPVNQLSSSGGYKIPQRSKKRLQAEKSYVAIITDAKKKMVGKPCFFCGEPLGRSIDAHHLLGRVEDDLTDERYIVYVHRECHNMYHFSPVRKIPWFVDYINRLSDKDVELAEKEMNKYNK